MSFLKTITYKYHYTTDLVECDCFSHDIIGQLSQIQFPDRAPKCSAASSRRGIGQ
jgi:hypothetical protein